MASNDTKPPTKEEKDELSFDLSDEEGDQKKNNDGKAVENNAEGKEEAADDEPEQSEVDREREEKLMEMIYECSTSEDVAAYIDSLESTLLAARGREYQLKIEEKRGAKEASNQGAPPSLVNTVLEKLKSNISVDCLERSQSVEEEDETVMLTIRINASEEASHTREDDAILWWHYDSIINDDEEGSTVDVRFSIAWGRDGEGLEEIKTLCRFDTTVEEESQAIVDKEQLKALLNFLLTKHSDEEKKLVSGNGLQTNFWELLISYVAPSLSSTSHQQAIAKQLRKALISTKKVDYTKLKSKATATPAAPVKPASAKTQPSAKQSSVTATAKKPTPKQSSGKQSGGGGSGGGTKRKADDHAAPSGKKGKKKKKTQKQKK